MRIDVNLGEPLERFIEEEVASGRYGSATEVIRTALELLQDHEADGGWTVEELRREIQIGIDSGPDIPAEEVFGRLEHKYRQLASEQETQ